MSELTLGISIGGMSAFGFALSAALQHRAAGALHEAAASHLPVLACLAGDPVWCAAMVLSAGSLVMHGIALTQAPLAVVQPMMMLGVVFAVPLRALLDHRWPSRTEVGYVVLAALGLTIFILAVRPSPPKVSAPSTVGLFLVLFACGSAWVLARQADRLRLPNGRALVLGIAAGILFGVTAALLKVSSSTLADSGALATVRQASTWLWIAAGLLGIAVNQRAYQRAPLAMSLPIINVTNVAVAVTLGLVLFGERPAHDLPSITLQIAGLTLCVYGVSKISLGLSMNQTPVVHRGVEAAT